MNQPLVSILIAARNEESNILDLLNSIEKLNYPKDKIQVLIGDDSSEDKTYKLVSQFVSQKPYYELISVKKPQNELKGKTNVLAQLAHLAKGVFYLYTDADIELPTTWIEEMLSYFFGEQNKNVGVVTGATVVKPKNVFEACQGLEWLNALWFIKILERYKIPVTGMGNNMAVSAKAYWAVGGFEKIGFSIVEDYALFRAIIADDFEFRQIFSEKILAKTKGPANIKMYFNQRKRWMRGGFESKSVLILLALVQAFFLPILLIISYFSVKASLITWVTKFIWQSGFSINMLKKIRQTGLIKYLFAFEFYMLIFPFCQILFYFLPTKTIWKGRSY